MVKKTDEFSGYAVLYHNGELSPMYKTKESAVKEKEVWVKYGKEGDIVKLEKV